jgi:hypothetical protein
LGGSDADAFPGPTRSNFLSIGSSNCLYKLWWRISSTSPPTFGYADNNFLREYKCDYGGANRHIDLAATNATSVTVTASSGSTSRTVTTSSQASGKVNDSPTQTTTYSAVASGSGGSSQPQTAHVQVGQAPLTLSFSASPSTIAPGQQVTLTWQVTGGTASALSVDPGVCGGKSKVCAPIFFAHLEVPRHQR